MQMVKKSLIVFTVTWIAIIVLMPKREMYYKLEEALAQYEITLNEKSIEEGWFSLNLEKVNVYFKGINVATIEEATLSTFIFYSYVKLDSLQVDDSLKNMVSQATNEAIFSHSVFAPFDLKVKASGSFGEMEGGIALDERKVHLDFNESNNLDMLNPHLKKSDKGWVYETSF